MNQPWIYMCSPSRSPLPPPFPSSQMYVKGPRGQELRMPFSQESPRDRILLTPTEQACTGPCPTEWDDGPMPESWCCPVRDWAARRSWAGPWFLTTRLCEIINTCYFKAWRFGVVCYTATANKFNKWPYQVVPVKMTLFNTSKVLWILHNTW